MASPKKPASLLGLPAELILMISSNLDETDHPSKLALAQSCRILRATVPIDPPVKDGERLLFLYLKGQWEQYVSAPSTVIFTPSPEILQECK